jgi:hypothetical protein
MEMPERMMRLETKMEAVIDSVDDLKDLLKEHVSWEEENSRNMDQRFSGKWVEYLTIPIIVSLVGAILTGLILLI